MRSDEIEQALAQLLGPLAASDYGLVITLRRHDEYEILIQRVRELEAELRSKDVQIRSMSSYAPLYLQALDELRIARKLLHRLGVDTSFISSLRG